MSATDASMNSRLDLSCVASVETPLNGYKRIQTPLLPTPCFPSNGTNISSPSLSLQLNPLNSSPQASVNLATVPTLSSQSTLGTTAFPLIQTTQNSLTGALLPSLPVSTQINPILSVPPPLFLDSVPQVVPFYGQTLSPIPMQMQPLKAPTNLPNNSFAPTISSRSRVRNDSRSPKGHRKQMEYQRTYCTFAANYFETCGICKISTSCMRNLEYDFEDKVLKRRGRALIGLPSVDEVRPPLKRPEIPNEDPISCSLAFPKLIRRRGNKSKTSEEASNAPGSSDNKPHVELEFGDKAQQQKVEIDHKLAHPQRLHCDIWHNEPGEHNSGPACCCKPKYRIGPLHNQFEGETAIPKCDPNSNNRDKLYHYRVMVTPEVNFYDIEVTKIPYNNHDYLFEGYSVFLHTPVDDLPPCQVLRFNLLYTFTLVKEAFPENFTVRSLDLLTEYVFKELLELLDLDWRPYGANGSCPVVHLLPRFVRRLEDEAGGTSGELLSANVILDYWIRQTQLPLIPADLVATFRRMPKSDFSERTKELRGTLAWKPGAKPPAIRVDQIDAFATTGSTRSVRLDSHPMLVHMTFTPMKLSLARDPKYKSVLKNYLKLLYLISNKPRMSAQDRRQLAELKNTLDEMDQIGIHRREITVELSSEGFFRTGICPDVAQFSLNMASLVCHIRCILSLKSLESRLGYEFKDKSILFQSLTHPSYRRTDFGTNQDHFHNTLTSCGPRRITYGDRVKLFKAWRKKGLSKMVHVMSDMPKLHEERSKIYGNERLEFLGDAVIEIIASIHLYFMFPDLPEGSLDAYRQALVQNQHLADLALRLGLHRFLLYTHSVDFCHDSTYVCARSDAFEAVMAAIALDGGLDVVDRIFGAVLFGNDERIHRIWVKIPPHPLQTEHPDGDREWVSKVPMLQKLFELESQLGIRFKHLRLLARALTIRKTGYNIYTLGDNQRLEFLGDSLIKYVTTDYLFRHFPRHHEGHLSLLKNSLVNKYTQAAVCSEIGLDQFVVRREGNSLTISSMPEETVGASTARKQQNFKNRADLLEAFVGALFVDKDLTFVERFCQVCFWPRIVEFILKQEWNDPKSKLQQCCLTFRSLNEDPELAHYEVLESYGPSNDREYEVGVYFQNDLLAVGRGRSVQSAEMDAARRALELHEADFRQIHYQHSIIKKRYQEPVISKFLNQLDTWDQKLVNLFVDDVPQDGRERVDPVVEHSAKRGKFEDVDEHIIPRF